MSRVGSSTVKRVLFHGGLLRLARLVRQRARALVLRYHAISATAAEVPYAIPEICLPLAAFRLQAAFLRRAYHVVPLDDLVAALERGGAFPPRAVAITFDDGYADNHALAFPVLRRLGLTATVYVATGSLDGGPPLWVAAVRALVLGAPGPELHVPGLPPFPLGPAATRAAVARALTRALVPLGTAERADRLARAAGAAGVDVERALAGSMLTWAQVKELAGAGWTIGSHTVTHLNVALADAAEAEREIAASREAIAARIGAPVAHFAYTNTGGAHHHYSVEVAGVLKRLGFRSGVTSRPGALRPGVDPLLLPRVGVAPRLAPVVDLAAALERQRLAA
ncbi:MAG TPA: polysaccharide deacetylase family protein [Candidatus Binatia bacterium]|nr:polysaccharide deacetylase family protein [Candidatus Binatia bacterium]